MIGAGSLVFCLDLVAPGKDGLFVFYNEGG